LLNEAAREYRALHEAWRGLNEEQMSEVWLGTWSVRDIAALLEMDETHESFMKAAAAVPAERVQPGKTAWKIVDGNSAHHYREHGEQVRAWRAARGI
jgi:hypothetical protein